MRDLQEIYEKAVYVVCPNKEEIQFKIGQSSFQIDELLKQNNSENFAFITAYNPASKKLSEKENEARQSELIKILRREDYIFFDGFGTNEERTWKPEKSLFVLNIDKKRAIQIAQKFGQNSIVMGEKMSVIELVWC